MDEYVCSFDEATLKVAITELNEEPDQRISQVETLRTWIRQQKHLKCPTDTAYLLQFLRTAKFSQLRARKVLEGHLTQKTLFPQWFDDIDLGSPEMQRFLATKLIFPLPNRDPKGRRIMFINYSAMKPPDPKEFDPNTFLKLFFGIYFYSVMNESDLVNGTIFIFDYTDFNMKWLTYWGLETMPKILKAWQGNFPGRFKGYHYYNPGAFFDAFIALIKPVMSKKFADRLFTENTMEEMYKVLPKECFPLELLPDDYTGPSQGTLQSIIDNFMAEVKTPRIRDYITRVTSSKWKSDTAKKADELPNESFRKLNVS